MRKELSRVNHETLLDVAAGLTDRAIAKRRALSLRGVQWRVRVLYQKLSAASDVRSNQIELNELAGMEIYNVRTCILRIAVLNKLIDFNRLKIHQADIKRWIYEEFGYVSPVNFQSPNLVSMEERRRVSG